MMALHRHIPTRPCTRKCCALSPANSVASTLAEAGWAGSDHRRKQRQQIRVGFERDSRWQSPRRSVEWRLRTTPLGKWRFVRKTVGVALANNDFIALQNGKTRSATNTSDTERHLCKSQHEHERQKASQGLTLEEPVDSAGDGAPLAAAIEAVEGETGARLAATQEPDVKGAAAEAADGEKEAEGTWLVGFNAIPKGTR